MKKAATRGWGLILLQILLPSLPPSGPRKVKFYLILTALVPMASANAETVYNCQGIATTKILFSEVYKKLDVSAKKKRDSDKITIILRENDGTIKGNNGQSSLKKVGNHYLEAAQNGNLILWTHFPATKNRPAWVIQQKAYVIASAPAAWAFAWECK